MFTDTYIEMVSKAKEIQGLWKQKVGDWVVDYNYMIPMLLDKKIEGLNKPIIVIGWLPTLDDLLGIAVNKWNKEAYYKTYPHEILADFIDWITNTDSNQYKGFEIDYFDTKDCFLIYIMETYFKIYWNGKEWEEINGS